MHKAFIDNLDAIFSLLPDEKAAEAKKSCFGCSNLVMHSPPTS